MMQHLRNNFINPLVYETTDAEAELMGVDWVAMMLGSGADIKAGLDKVCAITKLMPAGSGETEAGWMVYAMDRMPTELAIEYHRHIFTESIGVQQKVANSTRVFAINLARNMMVRPTKFLYGRERPAVGGQAAQ